MEKFQNKYRIGSARLQGYDYGQNGAYFITICTANREHYFGEIANGKMNLNELGKMAEKYWLEIPNQFSFVKLDEYVIMPNHTHGILIIDQPDDKTNGNDANDDDADGKNADGKNANGKNANGKNANGKNAINRVSTIGNRVSNIDNDGSNIDNDGPTNDNPTKTPGGFAGDKNPMFHENISRIIRWYKGRCTFEMRKIHADFAWQSRFHDHIIRNEKSFRNIANYISNNPKNWENDTLK